MNMSIFLIITNIKKAFNSYDIISKHITILVTSFKLTDTNTKNIGYYNE